VTDDLQHEVQHFAERGPAVQLSSWRLAPEAWRWAGRFNNRYVNLVFRLRSARVIPASMRARFLAMGIPDDIVDETLATIRKVDDWGDAWIETAQRFLGDYRRQASADAGRSADEARRLAAMSYHIAQILMEDDRTVTLCRASTSSLFAQAQPRLYPFAHRLSLPWRTGELPAYLLLPEDSANPAGVVVMLNGVTIAKEETFNWTRAYLRQGFAVVLIDSPGTGEATQVGPYSADHVDILDGVFELVHEQPNLDPRRVAVVGGSLGGNQAIRALGYDRRLLAAVTITPAYDPARWMRRASPLLLQQVLSLVGNDVENYEELAFNFGLDDVAGRIRKPVLVFGAGRDVIVPPGESQLLAARLGMQGTLVWFPDGGHGLYDRIPQWTAESAAWLDAIGKARIGEGYPQPVTDSQELAEIGRQALDAVQHADEPEPFDEEDIGDYARLVPPEEVRAARQSNDLPADDET